MNLRIVRLIDIYLGIALAYLLSFAKNFPGRKTDSFRAESCGRILLVKFWGVGNVVMLLPSAKAIREAYPGAKIDFLTLASNKEVSESAAVFDNVYTLDIKGIAKFASSCLNKLSELKNKDYDLIIDFEQFARFSAIFCRFIGRKNIIGFDTTGQHRHFLYTKSVQYNNNIHITKSFYQLAQEVGAGAKDYIKPVPLVYSDKDMMEVKRLLRDSGIHEGDKLVILHVGTSGNFRLRRWPVEYFARLSDKLVESFPVRIVFTGLSEESDLAKKAIGYLKNRQKVCNLSGKLNLSQFIALIKLSDLMVSADTAPVHLASCMDVPVAGLYGPNTPLLYGPWLKKSICFYKKLSCSPCITNYNAKINNCRHPQGQGACMKNISVEEVFLGIKENFFMV